MIRKHKKYSRPRTLYDKERITQENVLLKKYGLKNKREIWKEEAKVKYFRNRAKELITADSKEQQRFFGKLQKLGLSVKSIADILALTKEDIMARRLATLLVKRGLATTPQQARQMIVHKRITINHTIINSPSYLVGIHEEDHISLKNPPKAKSKGEITS